MLNDAIGLNEVLACQSTSITFKLSLTIMPMEINYASSKPNVCRASSCQYLTKEFIQFSFPYLTPAQEICLKNSGYCFTSTSLLKWLSFLLMISQHTFSLLHYVNIKFSVLTLKYFKATFFASSVPDNCHFLSTIQLFSLLRECHLSIKLS